VNDNPQIAKTVRDDKVEVADLLARLRLLEEMEAALRVALRDERAARKRVLFRALGYKRRLGLLEDVAREAEAFAAVWLVAAEEAGIGHGGQTEKLRDALARASIRP
jgi:hypothetical protein